MAPEEKLSILEANLSRQLQWIGSADSKSNFIFTISIAMLGLLAAVAPANVAAWSFFPALFSVATITLVSGAVFCAAHTVFPRTDGPVSSLIYCGSIADCGIKDFRDRINALQSAEYIDDLTVQCFRNASIANEKFRWVKRGMSFLYASALPWALATWLLYQSTTK